MKFRYRPEPEGSTVGGCMVDWVCHSFCHHVVLDTSCDVVSRASPWERHIFSATGGSEGNGKRWGKYDYRKADFEVLGSCAVNNQQSLAGHDLGCDFLCILHQEVRGLASSDIHDNTPKGCKDILRSWPWILCWVLCAIAFKVNSGKIYGFSSGCTRLVRLVASAHFIITSWHFAYALFLKSRYFVDQGSEFYFHWVKCSLKVLKVLQLQYSGFQHEQEEARSSSCISAAFKTQRPTACFSFLIYNFKRQSVRTFFGKSQHALILSGWRHLDVLKPTFNFGQINMSREGVFTQKV